MLFLYSYTVLNVFDECDCVTDLVYCIYSRISRQFLAQFWRLTRGVGLYAGHATQPVSMTAIGQRRSLCVPHGVDH